MDDPRIVLREQPFLTAQQKQQVLASVGPWDRVGVGLSMGSCLERPVGFDLVVTLDDRISRFDALNPDPTAQHISWSIVDGGPHPDIDELVALVGGIVDHLGAGGEVLVRCMAGLNRSGLVCAAALVAIGSSPAAAVEAIRTARSPHALSNPDFVDLINRMHPGRERLGIVDRHDRRARSE